MSKFDYLLVRRALIVHNLKLRALRLHVEPYIYEPFKNRAPVLSAPKVVVAGLGRCGTTLLTDVTTRSRRNIHYHTNVPLAYRISAKCMHVVNDYIEKFRIEKFRRMIKRMAVEEGKSRDEIELPFLLPSFGHIVQATKLMDLSKTHSYPFPDRPLPSHVRVIWMFGNPMTISVSLSNMFLHDPAMQKQFVRDHNANMETPFYKYHDDLLTRDTLMLERHFDAWYRPHAFPFLSVRYEAMERAEVRQAIADFVGFPLQFPRWEKRSTKWRSHPQRAQLEAAYGRLHAKVEAAEDVKLWQPEAVRPEWQER